jgi:hypothetical protein
VTGPVAAAACLLASACAGAGTARPPVSLAASPARVSLVGTGRQTIQVTNSGSDTAVVDVSRAGFALDLRGRPRVVIAPVNSPSAARWISVRPRHLRLAPGGSVSLAVVSHPPRGAEPGDHGALVLLLTRARPRSGLSVRMRIGIVVVVRVPGRIVHRVRIGGLRVRRLGRARLLELGIANRGNVSETLAPGCLVVSLRRDGRLLARLRAAPRGLLPRSRGIVEVRYRGAVRGLTAVRVEARRRASCPRFPRRVFRIRL